MREILFRGKREDTGEWVYGYYSALPDCAGTVHMIESPAPNPDETNVTYFVDPSTVGQFTGLMDKNGTKIFEGDILSEPERPKYTTGAIYYGRSNCSCCDGVYGFYSEECADLRNAAWLTVIGNIHDNPDLLKGGDSQ